MAKVESAANAVADLGKMSKGEWMQTYWRPCAAFMYMICCLADFAVFPIMFTVVQFWEVQAANDAFRQWVPITLQGGGLFHVSMCAVLGVSAYGRTQEKINGGNSTPDVPTPTLSSATPTPAPAAATPAPAAAPAFNVPTTAAPKVHSDEMINTPPAVVTGFGGKKAPPAAPEPLL